MSALAKPHSKPHWLITVVAVIAASLILAAVYGGKAARLIGF